MVKAKREKEVISLSDIIGADSKLMKFEINYERFNFGIN